MKFLLAFLLATSVCKAMVLRCGNGEVEAREDHFSMWSDAGDMIYADNELAFFHDGQCYYFGKRQAIIWKRLGGLSLPVKNGKSSSMKQVLEFNKILYHLKEKSAKVLLRKKLLSELQTHEDRIASGKLELLANV